MSERFYINCPLQAGPVYLDGAEAHHLSQVCRLRPGSRVILFNGDGQEYPAEVKEVSKRQVVLDAAAGMNVQRELPFTLEIAAPLPKGDRAHFLIEKLTEVGVTTFVPLETRYSTITPREGKMEKLERYVIEASKQCGRNVLMKIEPLQTWKEYCQPRGIESRLLAHPDGSDDWPAPGQGPVRIAIGPEGGFSEEEIVQARAHQWRLVRLGSTILRLETAALVAAARVAAKA